MADDSGGPSAFGTELRHLRACAGMTQELLAERSGISVDAISTLESGRRQRPHPQTVSLLAKGLGVGADDAERLQALARPARGGPRQAGPVAPIPTEPASPRPEPRIAGDDMVTAGGAAWVGGPVGVPLGRQPPEVRGREELLRVLVDERGQVVLAATGGMGKSTVAAEVGLQLLQAGRRVWWVTAADASSLVAGMVSVARQVGASKADLRALANQLGDAPDRLWTLLEDLPHGWLLVLDGADDPELLSARGGTVADGTGWCRASRGGLVLLTSRQASQAVWGRHARVVRLHPLSDVEAARVLLDLAPRAGDEAEAMALGRRLGGLPLALHLAGSNLDASLTRWSSFAGYLQALDRGPDGVILLTPDPDSPQAGDPRAAAMRTWELSLDDLAAHGLPDARAVLRLLSCFAPGSPIPIDVLDPSIVSILLQVTEPGGTPDDGADARLERVVRGLVRLGLVEAPDGRGFLLVHPVIADTNRAHLLTSSETDPFLVWRTAVSIVTAAVDDLKWRQPRDWPRFQDLTPHVRALLDVSTRLPNAATLANLLQASRSVVNANHMAGAMLPAADLTRAALARVSTIGEEHETILAFRQHLAYQARERGHWPAAEEGFRNVLERRQRVLGPDHPDTLDTRFHLAWTLGRRGSHRAAELAFEQVLEARRRILGDDHPDVLDTWHELARSMTALGRWARAEAIFRALLNDRMRVLGGDHPDTMTTRHFLTRHVARLGRWAETEARLLEAVGGLESDAWERPRARWEEAETEFRDLLSAQQRVLGDHHPDTLATRLQLARLAGNRRRWEEAEAALRDVLLAQRTILDEDHPNVLETRQYLAWTIGNCGRWDSALLRLREVVAARVRVHGSNHPYTLISRHFVAMIAVGREQWLEAERALRDLLGDRRQVLGALHPDTLTTQVELALVGVRSGRREEAEAATPLLQEARRLAIG